MGPFLISLLVIIVLGICYAIIYNVHKSFVIKYSVALRRINELNNNTNYGSTSFSGTYSHTYDNEIYYKSVSCRDYLIYEMSKRSKEVFNYLDVLSKNIDIYNNYLKEYSNISERGVFDKETGKHIKFLLKHIDNKECKKIKVKMDYPNVAYVSVILTQSLIDGEVIRRKSDSFYLDDVNQIYSQLNNRRGTYYQDKSIWDALVRVERAKVSNKMRFAIYKRDGYRCKYCGRKDNGNNLEVDHIYPIAKGGKTTFDNLQTLCWKCNKEKGDKIV